ncbi:MAG: preprotein translocase subunit YajC [Clostridiales bacterium]|nr:preprotein translocase subunit YajC [Clostridiales bacterium]MCF8022117.1 preprotein translocase subunit YajC [Clostridiales bacterium]
MQGNLVGVLYIVGLFALLWFLLIRPQQKRQKQHREMIANLNQNDNIVTIGGIHGSIVKLKDDTVILKVADNVRIEVLKNAISQVQSSPEEQEE